MENINIEHLSIIKGEQLSSVIFVQDYLQLDFDGPLLTCYKWPKVCIAGIITSFGDSEYRNAICQLISYLVIALEASSSEVLIRFDIGYIQFLMPDDSEVIFFQDNDKKWSYYPVR
jgi:hypothetical protein